MSGEIMITDFDHLYKKTKLLPIEKARELLKLNLKGGIDKGAVFMASDDMLCRKKYWAFVDRMKLMMTTMYMKLLSTGNHPQPESDFLEEFDGIPQFLWPEIIHECLEPKDIVYIVKHHHKTVASIIDYLIAALPEQSQAQAVQDAISVIKPEYDGFDAFWYSVSKEAREVLRKAYPNCKQANDIVEKLKNVDPLQLNDVIQSELKNIKPADCDDIIELALLKYSHGIDNERKYNYETKSSELSKREQTIQTFFNTQEYVIGNASNERLESLLCQMTMITHPHAITGAKQYFADKFPVNRNSNILYDAPRVISKIATDTNTKSDDYNDLKEVFSFVAKNVPQNVNVAELLLLFRMALASHDFSDSLVHKSIPEALSWQKEVSSEFFWQFRCDFGQSVLGIISPNTKDVKNYGCIENSPDIIDISNKSPAAVFAALYNYAWPQGMGFLHYHGMPMFEHDAQYILERGHGTQEYCMGRAMKIRMDNKQKTLNVDGYNFNNGRDIAQMAIRTCQNIK
ncbi:MAG: hypothetical protein LBK26_01280 [Rickettsiales bacterium]|jgi:hypothetical protein|nr:hypothetical protein [Rickettsiales bacterium]